MPLGRINWCERGDPACTNLDCECADNIKYRRRFEEARKRMPAGQSYDSRRLIGNVKAFLTFLCWMASGSAATLIVYWLFK